MGQADTFNSLTPLILSGPFNSHVHSYICYRFQHQKEQQQEHAITLREVPDNAGCPQYLENNGDKYSKVHWQYTLIGKSHKFAERDPGSSLLVGASEKRDEFFDKEQAS